MEDKIINCKIELIKEYKENTAQKLYGAVCLYAKEDDDEINNFSFEDFPYFIKKSFSFLVIFLTYKLIKFP